MTPIEVELLKLFAAGLAGLLATCGGVAVTVVKMYMKSIVSRIASISASVQTISDSMNKLESEMREQMSAMRLSSQHRDDVLAGNLSSRIEGIERVCEAQHGITLNRRTIKDRRDRDNWAQDSDITGVGVK